MTKIAFWPQRTTLNAYFQNQINISFEIPVLEHKSDPNSAYLRAIQPWAESLQHLRDEGFLTFGSAEATRTNN
jgi:hypothetical protein